MANEFEPSDTWRLRFFRPLCSETLLKPKGWGSFGDN
jgi:hypothetical protein